MESTVAMRVKLYATLRAIVGEPVVEIELPEGATARDLGRARGWHARDRVRRLSRFAAAKKSARRTAGPRARVS